MGAHFKALNEAVLMALTKILENCFPFRVSQPLCVPLTIVEGEGRLRHGVAVGSRRAAADLPTADDRPVDGGRIAGGDDGAVVLHRGAGERGEGEAVGRRPHAYRREGLVQDDRVRQEPVLEDGARQTVGGCAKLLLLLLQAVGLVGCHVAQVAVVLEGRVWRNC